MKTSVECLACYLRQALQTARQIISAIERFQPDARRAVFAALKNVRTEYLL